MLLLHGALQNWYAWREVLPALAGAGYRTVAVDLRGHGASDATPRGYDLPSLADDVDALVRSLGAQRAVVVGHDLGGWVGWTLAARHPERLAALVAVAAPPPRRSALRGPLLRALLRAQPPVLPERGLLHRGGPVAHLDPLRVGATPSPVAAYYQACIRVPAVAHTSLETWRWLGRSLLRPDGRRWWRSVRPAPPVPVLRVEAELDPLFPRPTGRAAAASTGTTTTVVLPGVGHLVPEEAPGALVAALLAWLPTVVPTR